MLLGFRSQDLHVSMLGAGMGSLLRGLGAPSGTRQSPLMSLMSSLPACLSCG